VAADVSCWWVARAAEVTVALVGCGALPLAGNTDGRSPDGGGRVSARAVISRTYGAVSQADRARREASRGGAFASRRR
jgi:hypothetical protein